MDKQTKFWAGLNQENIKGPPHIYILGVPYDHAVCFRKGAALGPDRIRNLSQHVPPTLETGELLKDLNIQDVGNLPVFPDSETTFSTAEKKVSELFSKAFVLTLGGDHSISIPIFKTLDRLTSKKIGILFLDAHTDLSDTFQGSPYSHACPLRRALEFSNIDPRYVALVGTRCFEPEGLRFIESEKLKYFSSEEVLERGIREVGKDLLKLFNGVDHFYISIDIDVLDPAFAPGTGIPEAGGLSTRDILHLIRHLDPLPVVGADLVEVAPPLDHSDITSFAALKIIMEIFGLVHRKLQRKEAISLMQSF